MRIFDGIARTIGFAMAGGKNPWGAGSEGNEEGSDGDDGADKPKSRGPRNPWLPGGGDEPRRSANIEDIFRPRGPEGPRRKGFGGPGGPSFRLPERPGGKSWFPVAIGAVALVWLGVSSIHFVQPREQGIVTIFGKFSRTLQPGTNFTLPWPIESVDIENVSEIRRESIPEGGPQQLILTGDQNLVDLSYIVRWNIKDLAQFRYQMAEPTQTVREVAEAAMRASVAEKELDDVLSGAGRAEIEARVRARMQAILDAYRAGVAVQGVEIEKTDPPERVVEAFKDVSAAQQDADAAMNRAHAYAQQLLARAQGDAAAFDKIYAQYKLAPEVTKRRLYYETMESVLSKTDKTIVEANGVTPYLPLPEIKRRAKQADQAQGQ